MKHKTKSLLITLLTALMIMTMLPTTAFAASKKVPSKVSITKVTASTNAVTVKWKKASNATSYRIYYKQSGAKKWKTVANVSGSKTSYTHKTSKNLPLVGGKKYVYTVRAYNKSSKKWGSYDTKGKTVTIPAVPSTVKMGTVKGTAYNKVSISWNKASNATSYRIYYKKSGAKNWTAVADVTGTSYTHTSSKKAPLTAGGKYVYTVRAYNKTSKKWGGYNTKGIAVTVPKKATPTPTPVSGPISKITFPKVIELKANVGDTYQLEQPVLTPSNPTNKTLVWTPDTPDDVLVDENGKITILNVDVDASVTAHSADDYRICGTCEIRIRSAVPVTSVSLSQTSINMEVGQRVDFTSTIAPANASNKRLAWGVYDDSIADVYLSKQSSSSDWFIVARKPGTVTLRLYSRYDETIYATCTVTVTETCEHEFDDGIVRYEPTCTEEGAKTVTCKKCGYMKRIDLPALGHTWEHHDATGHEEQVLIKDAYDEDVYEEHVICNTCGKDFGTGTEAEQLASKHVANSDCQNYSAQKVKTGTIHHDAEYESKWVEDTPAYDVCTVCGTTKE